MFNPVSTYRIQFHKDFTFTHFERIIPYLEKLGISTVYASPVFESTPGSTHGYDGLDPLNINPEIGTLDQLREISKQLKAKSISWIQDIVPNHMAFHPNNKWLMNLLENGPESVYKNYFDQGLADELFNGPIMVPFLGSDLQEVIDKGELKIAEKDGKLFFDYYGNYWPLNASSYDEARQYLANNDSALLQKIAGQQHYRLCSWKETDHTINFRRFFTVNGLICLNIHHDEVFDHFHQLINQLVKEGIFQGLRVDHIDGLYDPAKYLQQLRRMAGRETYIIVEKILEPGEEMPKWPIQGNTGYDFLATVNNLLTNPKSEQDFGEFYQSLAENKAPADEQVWQKKEFILKNQMGGESENLTRYYLQSGLATEQELKLVSPDTLKDTIAAFLIKCPVYRYYGNGLPPDKEERNAVKNILNEVVAEKPGLTRAVDLLKNIFLYKNTNPKALHFYKRCMQYTGPLMAKGVEDTLMYTYNRFIGHNEVGDSPGSFGMPPQVFHQKMTGRQQEWPLSMNGTSTHDTKRGEDVRARLNVLTDIPAEWIQTVKLWRKENGKLIKKHMPDANDEYFIYQTLIGTYPMPGEAVDNYGERLEQYLEKTLREAKQHSGWTAPNEAYETAAKQFANSLLGKKGAFWKSFETLHQKVAVFGVVNSLAQVLLKLTAPGVPDTYQGCDLWDLSMVDPDNRRPVDYEIRDKYLAEIADGGLGIARLWGNKFNGQIKLWLLHLLLQTRKNDPLVFDRGEYVPLQAEGRYAANIVAYARKHKHTWYIAVIPLGLASISDDPMQIDWEDTRILLPGNIPAEFDDLLLNTREKASGELKVSSLFKQLPLAFLKLQEPENKRGAGVLLHITSLPSPFGMGDFGPAARLFADALHSGWQKYWQLLPLSPVSQGSGFSPYSAWSGMGGNAYLISPELLADEGLLAQDDLERYQEPGTDQADFKTAYWLKDILFETAWNNFQSGGNTTLAADFEAFCKNEACWLGDFALYAVLKAAFGGKPWYQWPDKYKLRQKRALDKFAADNHPAIEKTRWLQFMFTRQWRQLRSYCNGLQIKLFGDLPCYVSYDSVDVWAHPDIFSLDENGNMQFVAGVPPDYFNANGQLWGMPVFRWDKLKAQKYDWWVNRVKKNMEYFDLLRLDHFRAFSSYWAVPATEETAINGTWEQGPGDDLFNTLKQRLGDLPFIAEDLGDIDDEVYALRDRFGLPGMKVLQFAFGGDMPKSPHIPHNYTENHVAYTGTHDNNTTRGWYRRDAGKPERKHLDTYTGLSINNRNVATVLGKMALSSVANIAIMPMQDLLGLDERARMNMPAETEGNWLWRMEPGDLLAMPVKKLRKWAERYNRV